MKVANAIVRASKFARPDKDGTIFTGIRLSAHQFAIDDYSIDTKDGPVRIPKQFGYVNACNGDCGILINISPTQHLPDAVVNAKAMLAALANFKGREILIQNASATSVVARPLDDELAYTFVPCAPMNAWPVLPKFPDKYFSFLDGNIVNRIATCAGRDAKSRPDLQFVHITPKVVEASDQDRIARIAVDYPWLTRGYLVDKQLFKNWPKKEKSTYFAIKDEFAFVYIEGEVRWSRVIGDDDYYDLSATVPLKHSGFSVVVDRLALMNYVKFGTVSSPTDIIELVFSMQDNSLFISGLSIDGNRMNHHGIKDLTIYQSMRMLVRGRKLWDSLNVLGTQNVEIAYSAPEHPLRLHTADGYISAIWPLIQGNNFVNK